MAKADALLNKLKTVLNNVKAVDRTVYKRVIVRAGGDPVIGRPGAVNTTDIALDPQPAIRILGADDAFVLNGSAVAGDGAFVCTVSAQALTHDELKNPDLQIVFKDDNNLEEIFTITGVNFEVFGGKFIVFDLLLRSKKR